MMQDKKRRKLHGPATTIANIPNQIHVVLKVPETCEIRGHVNGGTACHG
jgi:hypothetical protein